MFSYFYSIVEYRIESRENSSCSLRSQIPRPSPALASSFASVNCEQSINQTALLRLCVLIYFFFNLFRSCYLRGGPLGRGTWYGRAASSVTRCSRNCPGSVDTSRNGVIESKEIRASIVKNNHAAVSCSSYCPGSLSRDNIELKLVKGNHGEHF